MVKIILYFVETVTELLVIIEFVTRSFGRLRMTPLILTVRLKLFQIGLR
jgi:hypothetical protein